MTVVNDITTKKNLIVDMFHMFDRLEEQFHNWNSLSFGLKISWDSWMWTERNGHWCSLFKQQDRPTTCLVKYAYLSCQIMEKKSLE